VRNYIAVNIGSNLLYINAYCTIQYNIHSLVGYFSLCSYHTNEVYVEISRPKSKISSNKFITTLSSLLIYEAASLFSRHIQHQRFYMIPQTYNNAPSKQQNTKLQTQYALFTPFSYFTSYVSHFKICFLLRIHTTTKCIIKFREYPTLSFPQFSVQQ
jgi:hypothetical protein